MRRLSRSKSPEDGRQRVMIYDHRRLRMVYMPCATIQTPSPQIDQGPAASREPRRSGDKISNGMLSRGSCRRATSRRNRWDTQPIDQCSMTYEPQVFRGKMLFWYKEVQGSESLQLILEGWPTNPSVSFMATSEPVLYMFTLAPFPDLRLTMIFSESCR